VHIPCCWNQTLSGFTPCVSLVDTEASVSLHNIVLGNRSVFQSHTLQAGSQSGLIHYSFFFFFFFQGRRFTCKNMVTNAPNLVPNLWLIPKVSWSQKCHLLSCFSI
jgi:hypothetical protein